MLAIAVVALAIHLIRLGAPGAILPGNTESCRTLPPIEGQQCYELIPLDEVHYVPDARDVLRFGTESDLRVPDGDGQSGRYVVHPPVGKWFIAAGIWLFGDRPFGWRFFGAVIGSLASVVMYLIARRLWAVRWAAIFAGGLLAIEGLWFVQSRVAMLDIYAASFFLLGTWLLIEDRDRAGPEHTGIRWWRIGAGAAFGAALASKWSVIPLLAMLAGMALAWELVRVWTRTPRRLIRSMASFAGTMMLLPLLVYIATYTPWFLDEQRYSPNQCSERADPFTEQVCYHASILNFHRNLDKFNEKEPEEGEADASPKLEAGHPYFGEAWSWPWIGRPVAHHFETDGEGETERASEVLGLPNPAIWWPAFFIALPVLMAFTWQRGDPVASMLLGIIMAGWLPYLFSDLIERPVFLFYATPIVPFLVLGLVHVFVRFARGWPGARWALGLYAGLAVLMFAYFYPVLAAHPIPRGGPFGWNAHMWLSGAVSDCSAALIKVRCWI